VQSVDISVDKLSFLKLLLNT